FRSYLCCLTFQGPSTAPGTASSNPSPGSIQGVPSGAAGDRARITQRTEDIQITLEGPIQESTTNSTGLISVPESQTPTCDFTPEVTKTCRKVDK
ncbi:unnamed protein product, partial [Bubo scandiacus]